MTELIITRYIHFISFILVFASVFAESKLLKENMTRREIRKVYKLDGIYGLFALVAVGAGLYLWFGTGKPSVFYTDNPLFWVKIGLFAAVGLLSLKPTIFFYQKRKGHADDPVIVPRRIRFMVRLELILLLIIPLLAALMAQGVGL